MTSKVTCTAPTLTLVDRLRLQRYVALPGILGGTVTPNRRFWPYLVHRQSTATATSFLRSLRKKYGPRAWSWFPFRSTLLVLDGAGIEEVLNSCKNFADPFVKKLQLSTFTPHGAIISRPPVWKERRNLNDDALAFGRRTHPDGGPFLEIVREEVARMLDGRREVLAWDDFRTLAARISQQVIFGRGEYRDDFTLRLARLVSASNWGFIRRSRDCSALFARIDEQLKRSGQAGHGAYSLVQHSASWLAGHRDATEVEASSQIAFWLFVMKDAIELHTVRTLALIASAPAPVQRRLSQELESWASLTPDAITELKFLEACVTESLRLWTPIPILLRVALTCFQLKDGICIEEGQQVLLHAGSYHRDPEVFGAAADKFLPEQRVATHRPNCHSVTNSTPPLYVFSSHQQSCAGQFLIIFLLKATLAELLVRTNVKLLDDPVNMDPVPAAINHFAIRFWRR